jgi:SET domain-containing protein
MRRLDKETASMSAMPPSPIVVRRSRVQGRGIFAARDIMEGERIIEYTGERITPAQADARCSDDEGMRRHHTFLFSVSSRVVIDGGVGGNESRFINHSCDPNCDVVIARGRIYIHALRDIPEGEELFYDYWYETDDSYGWDDLRRIYPCRCRSANCRGTLARPPRRRAKAASRA